MIFEQFTHPTINLPALYLNGIVKVCWGLFQVMGRYYNLDMSPVHNGTYIHTLFIHIIHS